MQTILVIDIPLKSKQITIQNLDNLLVLDYDARLFMELIPSNIVGKVYVHFPVPWDKKPHRRVISTSFIEEARRVLKVDGQLELRTDSENYYAYSYETFINFQKTILHINKNKDIAISSKYEDRWKKMEKNIYDVTMINEEESDKLSQEGSFEFSTVGLSDEKLIELHSVTQRFDGGFNTGTYGKFDMKSVIHLDLNQPLGKIIAQMEIKMDII